MVSIMVTGFFLPDIVLYFVDRENLYIKNEEMPEITLDLIPELSVVKKAYMASWADYSDGVTNKMLRSSEEDIKQTAEKFLSTVLSKMSVSLEDNKYYVECCKPRMYFSYFSDIQETAVLWDVDFFFNDEVFIQIIVDDKEHRVFSFGIVNAGGSYYDGISDEMQQIADIVMNELAINLGVKNSWKLLDTCYEESNTDPIMLITSKLYQLYLTETDGNIYDRFSCNLELFLCNEGMFAGRTGVIDVEAADKIYNVSGERESDY